MAPHRGQRTDGNRRLADGDPCAVAIVNGKEVPAPATYELSFVQNPSLPTVDVYAQAPTTEKAIALADGAVTGFAEFINHLNANGVPQRERVEIRQLGQATGGIVDPGAGKKIGVLVFLAVFAMWCWFVLFVSRVRADLRATQQTRLASGVHSGTAQTAGPSMRGQSRTIPEPRQASLPRTATRTTGGRSTDRA